MIPSTPPLFLVSINLTHPAPLRTISPYLYVIAYIISSPSLFPIDSSPSSPTIYLRNNFISFIIVRSMRPLALYRKLCTPFKLSISKASYSRLTWQRPLIKWIGATYTSFLYKLAFLILLSTGLWDAFFMLLSTSSSMALHLISFMQAEDYAKDFLYHLYYLS